jgi:hypothetical protein
MKRTTIIDEITNPNKHPYTTKDPDIHIAKRVQFTVKKVSIVLIINANYQRELRIHINIPTPQKVWIYNKTNTVYN